MQAWKTNHQSDAVSCSTNCDIQVITFNHLSIIFNGALSELNFGRLGWVIGLLHLFITTPVQDNQCQWEYKSRFGIWGFWVVFLIISYLVINSYLTLSFSGFSRHVTNAPPFSLAQSTSPCSAMTSPPSPGCPRPSLHLQLVHSLVPQCKSGPPPRVLCQIIFCVTPHFPAVCIPLLPWPACSDPVCLFSGPWFPCRVPCRICLPDWLISQFEFPACHLLELFACVTDPSVWPCLFTNVPCYSIRLLVSISVCFFGSNLPG